MPQRYSINREQLTSNLRRSPRFLHNNLVVPKDPRSPNPKSSRTRITSLHPPFGSTQKISIKKTHTEAGSRKVNESNSRPRERYVRPNIGLRRSARLVGRLEEFSYVELSPKVNEEKRITRSASRRNANSNAHKSNKGKSEKATRSLCHGNADQFHEKIGNGISTIRSSGVTSSLVEGGCKMERGNIDEGQKQVGVKRKRNPAEKGHGIVQGWTKDQESALERAYFVAKPTPQFWKKVARLVPGKSAKDCFDKVHSNHMTPPQPQPRSRAKALNSSPLSFSASKLLNSSGLPVKRPRNSHLVQKTVRHMLQKQCQVNQDSEADLFSVFERRMSPSAQAMQQNLIISTPVGNQEKSELLKRCQERSSSAHKKSLSRFSGSSGTTLVSPPVLKQVKNKAMHEKYIDLLHCREASRKVVFARAAKSHQGNGLQKESHIQKKDAIKDAKNALVFDATNAIKQFHYSQANTLMSSLSDDDDDDATTDEDQGEDVF